MRQFLVFLALVVVACCAFDIQDVPQHMRERVNRYVEIQRNFKEMWSTMSEDAKVRYEDMLLGRQDKIPQIHQIRLHEIVEKIPEDYQHRLLLYLKQSFLSESGVGNFDSELDEIVSIIAGLPSAVRDQIHSSLRHRFEETYKIEVSVK